ncbi:hypothetical protein DFJ73DRAFT_792720, partial [Zopfochytrium polystomum]
MRLALFCGGSEKSFFFVFSFTLPWLPWAALCFSSSNTKHMCDFIVPPDPLPPSLIESP